MYYEKSRYVCLCGDTSTDAITKLPTLLSPSNMHHLGDLYFCPSCQGVKCIHCCHVAVECKYCVNCMTDFSDQKGVVRCSKNCFECPQCKSPLPVSVEDAVADGAKGKCFTFACVVCDYTYKTLVITKPAALKTIIKNENPIPFTNFFERFSLLHKLAVLEEKSQVPRKLNPTVLARMKAMDIQQPTGDQDEASNITQKLSEKKPLQINADDDFNSRPPKLLPLGRHLTAKRSYLCDSCRTMLSMPVGDHRLMKIVTKEFASDIVPTVTAKVDHASVLNFTPGSDTQCSLNIVNVTDLSISVTVSILSQLPKQFMNNNATISISFPFTHFSVQGRREKLAIIDSIPSPYLTSNTKTARAEQLMRASRREAQRRKTEGDEFKEVGANWVSVPFSVAVTSNTPLLSYPKIPFYITIESKLPDTWKPHANRRGLKYGFWVVCQVE